MSLLTLVRHGQSEYNLENRFTGNLDVALTGLGEEEARRAATLLQKFHYSIAYTSMLKRAQETLRIILEEIGQGEMPVVKSAALDERMYGSLQGLNKTEMTALYGTAQVERWRRSYSTRPPGGESLEDTFNRTAPYYDCEIAPRLRAEQNVLVVAHGNSLRALMMHLEHIDPQAIEKVNIPTGVPRDYTLDKDLKILAVSYLY